MNKIIIILLIIPLLLQAQKVDEWLTPFADARFEEGKIIYSFSKSEHLMITSIVPRYYSESLMELKMDFQRPAPNIKDVATQQHKIREYLVEEQLSALKPEQQIEYLRFAAIVLIWDTKLDREVITQLKAFERSGNREINKQVGLILKLEEVYSRLQ